MRLELFDFLDWKGWTLPVIVRIEDLDDDFVDVSINFTNKLAVIN